MSTLRVFAARPLVIAALHLPPYRQGMRRGLPWLEDYVATNARVFAEAGIPYVKLQDQTRTSAAMAPEALALLAALGRFLRAEAPGLGLGLICEAHDPKAAIAAAAATGADFVRLKVFVGGMMTAQGPRHGLGAEALAYRDALGQHGIALLADVHDRTAVPLAGESPEFAAEWAVKTGADGLIVTGADFPDTLARIERLRAQGVRRPILIGGSVTEGNCAAALAAAEGVIVSTALMRRGTQEGDILRWDADLARRFMDAARAGESP